MDIAIAPKIVINLKFVMVCWVPGIWREIIKTKKSTTFLVKSMDYENLC